LEQTQHSMPLDCLLTPRIIVEYLQPILLETALIVRQHPSLHSVSLFFSFLFFKLTITYSDTVPNPPLQPSFVSITSSSLTVEWSAPTDNGTPIQTYLLFQSSNGVNFTLAYEGDNLTFSVSGLDYNTTYAFYVCIAVTHETFVIDFFFRWKHRIWLETVQLEPLDL
jgi:hypothetical protein